MKHRFGLLIVAGLLFAGCGEEELAPTPEEVSGIASRNLDSLSTNLASLIRQLLDSPWARSMIGDDCSEPPEPTEGGEGTWDGDDSEDGFGEEEPWEYDCSGPADNEWIEETARWLTSRVFDKRNHEATEGAVTIFRLRPEVVCDRVDDHCRELLREVAIRLHVTNPAPETLVIGVGVDELRPATFTLSPGGLAATADLADAYRAALRVTDAEDDDVLESPLTDENPGEEWSVAGKVELALDVKSAGEANVRISVLEAVAISNASTGFSLSVARATPAASFQILGGQRRLISTLSLGAVELDLPSDDDEEDCAWGDDGLVSCLQKSGLEGVFSFRLGGLSGVATLEDWGEHESFSVQGLKVAGASLSLDGAQLASLEIGSGNGQGVDLSLSKEDGGLLLEVEPRLDLLVTLQLANVQDRLEDVPAWALDEALRVRLEGAERPALRIRGEEDSEVEGDGRSIVEVVSGTLTLESTAYGEVSVAAGMCLNHGGEPSEDGASAHPFEGLEAGACL